MAKLLLIHRHFHLGRCSARPGVYSSDNLQPPPTLLLISALLDFMGLELARVGPVTKGATPFSLVMVASLSTSQVNFEIDKSGTKKQEKGGGRGWG